MTHKEIKSFKAFFTSKRFLSWIVVPLLLIYVACWILTTFGYAINVTDSLPQKIFFVHFNQKPKVGDYIVFKAPKHLPFPNNLTLTKQVIGQSGDVVTEHKRDFYVNGKWVGKAKTHSLKGEPLEKGPIGVIPEGQYYVATDHKDSFDSRYQNLGWVSLSQCVGVAYPLW